MSIFSEHEIDQFSDDGYVVLRGAFSPEVAAGIRDSVLSHLPPKSEGAPYGYPEVVHIKETYGGPTVERAFTPKLHDAVDELLGQGRWIGPNEMGWWPVSFPGHASPPWRAPTEGWHVDGQHFHHHVNSPEQGLLSLFLLSDIAPGGGGTAIAPGSQRFGAWELADAEPGGLDAGEICVRGNRHPRERVIEITGQAGDVALMHPFMSHARSMNTGGGIRIICNPVFRLKEPFNYDRPDGDYSVVESATRKALADHLRA